jgi:hypothetical protein
MERTLVLTLVSLTLLAIGLAVVLPGGRVVDPDPKLPWRITLSTDGSARVFGLILGHSALAEAQRLLGEKGELTLFVAKEDRLTLEAYFDRVVLSGLQASMVLTLHLPREQLRAMYDRGSRVSRLGSGEAKVTLSEVDRENATHALIQGITYLPLADVPEEVLGKRFGPPTERIPVGNGIVHWLYPDQGLDIILSPGHKEVFQYVPPRDFSRLVQGPLRAATAKKR